jgi:tripeptide aminopeptidase
VGLAVRLKPIRGGTDGARLSFMGLPTPNLFAGEYNFHSRLEWVSAQDMDRAVAVIVELCRVWEKSIHVATSVAAGEDD